MKEKKLIEITFGQLKNEEVFIYKGDRLMKFGIFGMGVNDKGSVVEQIPENEIVQKIENYFKK